MRLVVALLIAVSSPAAAQVTIDGNRLHANCIVVGSERDQIVKRAACLGFMTAAAEAASATGNVCIPTSATITQIRDVTVKHLRDRPEVRHRPALLLTIEALEEDFPCL